MVTHTKNKPATANKATPLPPSADTVKLAGRNKVQRLIAFDSIAAQSMSEALSRQAVITTISVALGAKPSDNDILAARNEYIIGKVAMKLKGTDNVKRLSQSRDIVLHYASCPQDGVATRPLRAGQKGYRTPEQQRAYGAAKEQFSKIAAELKIGNAKTQAEADASKAVGRPAGKGKGASTVRKVTKDQAAAIVAMTTSAAKMTRDMATTHIATQMANLLAFCNKHAAIVPLSFSEPVNACKALINTAMNTEQERTAETVKF